MKQKIMITSSVKGHDVDEHGIMLPVQTYEAGKTYEVGASLARSFVSMGKAKILETNKVDAEKLKTSGAPENKMLSQPQVAEVLEEVPTKIEPQKKKSKLAEKVEAIRSGKVGMNRTGKKK